jgi:acyl-CoA synthetase (AMP-forming)/AMP-acid ligase II
MDGYYGDDDATREVLSKEGWLNTGDLAYRFKKNIVITGRETDQIIVNSRNIWPQDLEGIAEQQPEVRTGDARAISVPGIYSTKISHRLHNRIGGAPHVATDNIRQTVTFASPPRLPEPHGRLTINPGGLGESILNRKAGGLKMTKMI